MLLIMQKRMNSMSDPKDNKQDKEQENQSGNEIHTEWQRVLGNPDNLIVSDSLRAALPDEFSTDENISSILEVSIELGDIEIESPLTRLDLSKKSWMCQSSVDPSDAAVLLSYDIEEIQNAVITIKDKGNVIKTLSIDENHEIVLSVDTDGHAYFVTLSCAKGEE